MLQQDSIAKNQQGKHPITKAHYVGTSVVLTLHPSHVKRLGIDEFTFFIQKPAENGIVLELCRLDVAQYCNQDVGSK